MKFLNPSGFWLLLGVPLLIIIYIIKSRHEDRPVSSTYIWKLSSKLKKKRFPIQRIRKLLLFLMQLLMIVLLSFVAAQPAVAGGAGYDTIVILDASASMQSVDEGKNTRFEKAISNLRTLSKKTEQEHTFTLILANDTPTYSVRHAQSENDVQRALDKVTCSYGGCDEEEALRLASEAAGLSDNARVFFYTDHSYETTENVTVIDLSNNPWNVALQGLEMERTKEKTYLFRGTLTSYGSDTQLTVGLKLDDQAVDAKRVTCQKDTAAQVVFELEADEPFDIAEIYVDVEDALNADNSYALCNCREKLFSTLLVSERPLYIESALNALGNCSLTVVESLEGITLSGWDLYVFDGIAPKQYPTDGAVLVFGVDALPNGLTAGISYDTATKLKVRKETSLDLCKGLSFDNTVIKKYKALIGSPEWTTLLSCGNASVLMTTQRPGGMQCSVFSFDLHDSNLPLQADYLGLIQNIINYSLPAMMNKSDYIVGETAQVSVLPGTEKLYIGYPGESFKELSVSQTVYPISLNTVGVYSVVARHATKDGEYTDFFVHVPPQEMENASGKSIVTVLNEQTSEGEQRYDSIFFYIALAVLLFLLIEWGVYYSEQY